MTLLFLRAWRIFLMMVLQRVVDEDWFGPYTHLHPGSSGLGVVPQPRTLQVI